MEQSQSAMKPKEETDADPPYRLWQLVVIGNTMLTANFTVIMPASAQVTEDRGGTLLFSGLVIGSYAIGSLCTLPLMVYFSKHSYKGACLFMAATAILGNCLYAYAGSFVMGWSSKWCLVLARFICGLEGGLSIVFNNAFLRCSSGTSRVTMCSTLMVSSSLGIMIG
eukprot:CAMPEP_0180834120 /NCGR_PEP_ID=MMETSP1038_2-20121128/77696_1 /TAXON_ID=632150 /ORGANISM="Azadinium spinosum, Strain 3D9" /LENGTH=166 /DNA_ID=CAMNT_0022877351 /DNA_START=429 /DNA_END=926 /DNA_ORIENTATION=-